MVDAVSIGGVPIPDPRPDLRTAATAVTATPAAPASPQPQASAAPQIAALAKAMASSAPVDTDRVQEIKQAIANGTFPILPATIADQMMAMRYDWMQHDAA